MKTLDLEGIKSYILHRHENLLVDEIINFGDEDHTKSDIISDIKENDVLNRDIFFKQHPNGKRVYSPQALLEMLAIGCIVLAQLDPKKTIAFYAGISNFEKYTDSFLNQKVIGKVATSSLKSGFLSTQAQVESETQTPLVSAKISAFIQPLTNQQEDADKNSDKQKKKTDIPTDLNNTYQVVKNSTYKPDHMYMVDNILKNTDTEIVGDYTFPESHPLVKGHFPGNPVFMGILQWTVLEDVCLGAIQQKLANGESLPEKLTISGNGAICKPCGSLIAEIKQFTLEAHISESFIYMDMKKVKKILFRDMVRPGDRMLGIAKDIHMDSL